MPFLLPLPETLPIARYRFEFLVTEDLLLPAYSGSTLRGVFGHALKRVVCMTKAEKCSDCPLLHTCPYTEIFEMSAPTSGALSKSQNIPQGYIIEPPDIGERLFKKGEAFSFTMVLLGKVIARIALINFAWQKAFERGVRSGGKASLIDMQVETAQGYESILGGQYVLPHNQSLAIPKILGEDIVIKIETPLRLQSNGHALAPNNLSAEVFLTQLLRRLSWISEIYFDYSLDIDYYALKRVAESVQSAQNLQWYDWTRYSNRQQQKMHLGGVVGEWSFSGLSKEFQQLLYVGQWLHAGKNCTFGMGKYQIIHP